MALHHTSLVNHLVNHLLISVVLSPLRTFFEIVPEHVLPPSAMPHFVLRVARADATVYSVFLTDSPGPQCTDDWQEYASTQSC